MPIRSFKEQKFKAQKKWETKTDDWRWACGGAKAKNLEVS
jgi:hypothetical protein